MFYSHELLTDRQYGVATIWLVATLGSKSNLKKVTRKAITEVDVPKACDTITNPEAPLALRLQASLLYGVSRVYSHQCGYMLNDMHSFRDKMRGIEQVMKELEIDPDVGKTRPEQLNLPEDPAFLPELDLGFDLTVFDLPSDTSRAPSILSSQTIASSRTSLQGDEAEPVLELPSNDTPGGFDAFGLNSGGVASSLGQSASRKPLTDVFEESPIIQDPDFEIGDDGSIVPLPSKEERDRQSKASSVVGAGRGATDSAISAQVRAEHAAGINDDQPILEYDDEPLIFGDDENPLPQAKPFSPRPQTADPASEQLVDANGIQVRPPSALPDAESITTTTAEAPQRKARPVKQLQIDVRAELSNRDLAEWNNNYVANMAAATRNKELNKSLAQARKNAAYWVMEQGIGGVDVNFGDERDSHPLAIFSGQALLDALTGVEGSQVGSKRSRSPSPGEDPDDRRVRARTEEAEVGRGEAIQADDEVIFYQVDDDFQIESEVARRAESSLPDHGSIMPWNLSGSRQGSAPAMGSTGYGVSSSAGGIGGVQLGPRTLSRRDSRLTSASPLLHKGIRLPSLAIQDQTEDLGSEANFNPDDLGLQMGSDDFELYGPSAQVDTQTAGQSQWVKDTLEDEAHNFFEFLETQIAEKGEDFQEDDDTPGKFIMLDTLLPPETNSKVVAAQALLHILSLTTKGLLEVEQQEERGDVRLRLVPTKPGPGAEDVQDVEMDE